MRVVKRNMEPVDAPPLSTRSRTSLHLRGGAEWREHGLFSCTGLGPEGLMAIWRGRE